jgi:hypothetical protein
MQYHEVCGNIHIHTIHSDGTGRIEDVARAANDAGLDFCIITDHNAYHPEQAGWHGRTLVLVGEELHDPARPHANHLLALGASRDPASRDPAPGKATLQERIDAVRAAGGLAYLAHPIDRSGSYADEPEINWVDRDVTGFHGIELWNYMSEFKSHVRSRFTALLYAHWPTLAMRGPYPETLRLWDRLLEHEMIYAIGGSDAHAKSYRMGPLERTVFSYRHLMGTANSHLLVREPWTGDLAHDERLVYEALAHGRGFVGYDRLAPTQGTRLLAEDGRNDYTFGETVQAPGPVWFRAQIPARGSIRLLHNGAPVAVSRGRALACKADAPGVYRLEVYRRYAGRQRGWIFGNPIRIVRNANHAGSS